MGHSATHRQLHGYFNDRQFDRIKEHLATEFMFEDLPRALTVKNHDEFIDYLKEWPAGFSDASIGSAQYFEGTDHSVATFHARGHNDGEMAGMPPTGRDIDVPFCEVIHYGADGKVLSGELYYDVATMLTQLGVMEAPGSPSPPQAATPSPTETVRSFFDAMDRQDFATLRTALTQDAQGVDEITRGWLRGAEAVNTYLDSLAGAISGVRSVLSDFDERVMGDTAVVTCWLEQDYVYEGAAEHISAPCTVILRREAGAWLCALMHAVALAPE